MLEENIQTSFLTSAMRSGNTWTHYIIEYIARRQTIGYIEQLEQQYGWKEELQKILSWDSGISISNLKAEGCILDIPIWYLAKWDNIQYKDSVWNEMYSSVPVLKRHDFNDHIDFKYLFQSLERSSQIRCKQELVERLNQSCGDENLSLYNDLSRSCKLKHLLQTVNTLKMITIVRHPAEYLVRVLKEHYRGHARHLVADFYDNWNPKVAAKLIEEWLEILRQYDQYTGPKLLVRYEDLINKPRDTVRDIVDFISHSTPEREKRYLQFFENYDFHKKSCIEYYQNTNGGRSYTRGENTKHHSKDWHNYTKLDSLIQNLDSRIYEKYILPNYGSLAGKQENA